MSEVTFWAQANPGIRYVRCELPARAIGARVADLDVELRRVFGRARAADVTDPRFGEVIEGMLGDVSVWQLPANRVWGTAMAAARQRGQALIVEVDDDYTEWRGWEISGAAGWTAEDDGDPFRSSVAMHRYIVERADGVIVSTPYLAERYQTVNENVIVCENTVDPADWETLPLLPPKSFTIGWAGTIGDGDWPLARRAMEWAAKQPGVKTVLFGDRRAFPRARFHSWTNDLGDYRRRLVELGLDVGIRPLQNSEFARSKSDLRILEYAMAGALPIVSMVEPYSRWRDTPVLFAATPREWEQKIRLVLRDRELAGYGAERVREVVLRDRSVGACRSAWEAAVRALT